MSNIEFVAVSRNIVKAFIDTPYRDDLQRGEHGYNEIPELYKCSGDLDNLERIIAQGDSIDGENLHGHMFLVQRNGKNEYACDFSTIYNGTRYILTCYNASIQIFRDSFPVPADTKNDAYLHSGYLDHKRGNLTSLSQDSEEYHELLIMFSKTINRFAHNRGLFRTITPEKLNAIQKIVDSNCFILLHSDSEHVAKIRSERIFWNNYAVLKHVMTYDLGCSQLKKVKDPQKGNEPLTAEEIINYTYRPEEHPATIIFAIPNAIFEGFDKKIVYEAIIDFKEYDPLVEREREHANEFLRLIAAMPDSEEKQEKQKEFLLHYGKRICAFVPKDLIAGLLNAQGEFQQNPEWIVLQPNMNELISIHRQRLLTNIREKEEKKLQWYSQLAETRNIER